MNLSPVKAVWNKTPSFVKWGLLVVLALVVSFGAGRYSAPSKVTIREVVDVTTEQKLKEVTAERDSVKQQYALLQQEKQKVVTETKYVHDRVLTADANTKCEENFDRRTGHLVRRLCEQTTSVTDVETTTKLANVTSERDTLKLEVSSLTTEKERLAQVERDFIEHKRTEREKTVTTEARPGWRIGASALLEPSTTLELKDVEFGVTVERRLFGELYLGAQAIPQANLYGLTLSLGF
jgi:hypothetical protein